MGMCRPQPASRSAGSAFCAATSWMFAQLRGSEERRRFYARAVGMARRGIAAGLSGRPEDEVDERTERTLGMAGHATEGLTALTGLTAAAPATPRTADGG